MNETDEREEKQVTETVKTAWAVVWKSGIDPLHPDDDPIRKWTEYATEAEANAAYERLRTVRKGEIAWSREGGEYHPEWALTVYEPVEVAA